MLPSARLLRLRWPDSTRRSRGSRPAPERGRRRSGFEFTESVPTMSREEDEALGIGLSGPCNRWEEVKRIACKPFEVALQLLIVSRLKGLLIEM